MMSAFFLLSAYLFNKVILILGKFFLKYEGGGGQIDLPKKKLLSKSPALA